MKFLRALLVAVATPDTLWVRVPRADARRSPRGGRLPSVSTLANAAVLTALALLALWLLGLQEDLAAPAVPPGTRSVAALGVLLAYAGLCLWARPRRAATIAPASASATGVLVVHASQTGFASELAARTAALLTGAGQAPRVAALGEVDARLLAQTTRLLLIASTTGEGDAPDPALPFVRDVLGTRPALAQLKYAVLALGDQSYTNYCAFGRRLDAWLGACGAQALFERIEVDDGDAAALGQWQARVRALAEVARPPAWDEPRFMRWSLRERRLLNPGSAGTACYHLALAPPPGVQVNWQAGDVAVVAPRNAPEAVHAWLRESGFDAAAPVASADGSGTLAELLSRSILPPVAQVVDCSVAALAERLRPLGQREYSVASLPADGQLDLLVRHSLRPDGSPGVGAAWLTVHAALGATIELRLRSNPNFHLADDARPLILIGNGSGMAGLRSLLKQRIARGQRRNWLLFGERNASCDFHYGEDILRWRGEGFLDRLDLAFSRDQAERVHVQDRLRAVAPLLRAWIDAGAAIHVCGSREGMAPGVEAVLVESIGRAGVDHLMATGRYRRDVY